MTSDTSLATLEPVRHKPEAPPRFKFRVRFAKTGDLRFVSHHDLMHVCERMFRRAELSIPPTQGFNPRPRMWFASAMALGVAGLNEILEFELLECLAVDEVERRLAAQAPPGLTIRSVRAIDARSSARVRRALYQVLIGGGQVRAALADAATRSSAGASASCYLQELVESLLMKAECWIERRRPHPRRINVRPFIHELRAFDDRIEMALWITDNGAARPDEILAALGLQELLDAGVVIERTDLEVFDELPPNTDGPPLIQGAIEETSAIDSTLPQERPKAIFDSPMSFDS